MCDTPNRPVRNTPITPNRPVRNAHYSEPATEEIRLYGVIGHTKDWKPCVWDPMCYFGTNNPFLIDALWMILPTGQWVTPHYSKPATEERRLYGAIRHIKHWKPCQGDLMCYFGTNNPFFWYMHHVWYSQPASEERPITPNRPLRNGCILQYCGARETN